MSKKVKIEPIDSRRCQTEKPNGNSFMTFGGVPGLERCKNTPTRVLVEKEPGKDGEHGAMAVCPECFAVFKKQIGLGKTLVFDLLT